MSLLNPLTFHLIPIRPQTVFSGQVAGSPTSPYVTINYDNGSLPTGTVQAGQTVWFGTSQGGRERGLLRLKSYSTGTSGSLTVAESDDVGPIIADNDYITIKDDFRLWPRYPRIVQNGTVLTFYEDYDIVFTDQTINWRPMAVAGPPGVGFIEAGQAAVNFVGDRSYALADGATVDAYLWEAEGSTEGTSTSQGTEGSPVVFTWTNPGIYHVSLRVTDSNGNTHRNWTYVVIIDPANDTLSFESFYNATSNIDFGQGGGTASFTVSEANCDTSQFPDEMAVILAYRGPELTTPTGSWPFRTNVLFVGYVLGDSVRQSPESGDVSFRIGTIDKIMKTVSAFPMSMSDRRSPNEWTMGYQLTVDRVAGFVYLYRSTLSLMTSIVPLNYDPLIARQDFGPRNMFAEIQNGLMRSCWGQIGCTHQSVLYHQIDYNVQNTTERLSITTRKTLHKGIWVGDVGIEEINNYTWPANRVKMSGVVYPGNEEYDICPIFSEAPGDAMKVYGNEVNIERLILASQDDLNVRTGHKLEQENKKYPVIRAEFLNDGSFTVTPQELFPIVIEAGDNDRGVALSTDVIPRKVSNQYDSENGLIKTSVDFEPVTSGTPGVTVVMPCDPPKPEYPGGNPNDRFVPFFPIPPPETEAAFTATTGTSWYLSPGVGQGWQTRVNGLNDTKSFLGSYPDIFSVTLNGGYNPTDGITMWGVGKGFMATSPNSGINWAIRTNSMTQPSWAGDSDPALADVDFVEYGGNPFVFQHYYVLARWQNGSNQWRGAIGWSVDGGYRFTWNSLNNGDTEAYPMGMMVNQGNRNAILVTLWADGNLYLRRYNTSLQYQQQWDLGVATIDEVISSIWVAYPFQIFGRELEWIIFGRMNQPVGFTGDGACQVIFTNDEGASWTLVENTWGKDVCGALVANNGDEWFAVRNVTTEEL